MGHYDDDDRRVCTVCGYVARKTEKTCPSDGFWLVLESDWRADPDDGFLGRILDGGYAIDSRLERTGYGTVYRAVQQPGGRTFAIRVLPRPSSGAADLRTRFDATAPLLCKIRQPNAGRVIDYGISDDESLYLVLEYVEGHSLQRHLAPGAPLSYERSMRIGAALLAALSSAHKLDIVHGNVSDANVVFAAPGGRLRLLDFGVAPVVDGPGKSRQTDVYSAGLLLYHCLVGRHPFDGVDRALEPPPPMPADMDVPTRVEAVVRKALYRSSSARYGDALEMAQALRAATTERPARAPQPEQEIAPTATAEATVVGQPAAEATVMGQAPAEATVVGQPGPEATVIGQAAAETTVVGQVAAEATVVGQVAAEPTVAPATEMVSVVGDEALARRGATTPPAGPVSSMETQVVSAMTDDILAAAAASDKKKWWQRRKP